MLCHCLLVPVGRSVRMEMYVVLLLLLLGEVLSGLAVFGGLVGRRGLGGVCTRGQGVGDGDPTRHHALQRPWDATRSHSDHTRRVSVDGRGQRSVRGTHRLTNRERNHLFSAQEQLQEQFYKFSTGFIKSFFL